MPVKFRHNRAVGTTAPSHEPNAPPVPVKKDEQEVRRKHDIPPPRHHDPEDEGVLGEADRPAPPSEKPEAL